MRRSDSGVPHEEPMRSDSVSTEGSHSPPEQHGSNHSETSSGIHSNESTDHKVAEKITGSIYFELKEAVLMLIIFS